MRRKITINYDRNYFKLSDSDGSVLKTIDLYQKKIVYENMNEKLIRFFLGYKNDFDFLNEMNSEFLHIKEANIYENLSVIYKRDSNGLINEKRIRINSLEKEFRVKYKYDDFFDLLEKELYYDGEIISAVRYVYENGYLICIRKLDLGNFDSEGEYFSLENNMDFSYDRDKLSYIKSGEEEFTIEYRGDTDIFATSSERRFCFSLNEKLQLVKLETYVYYEENEEIKDILFMEKEFYYEKDKLIKRVMKIGDNNYITHYTYNDMWMLDQIITIYNNKEIYRKSFDGKVTETEVWQKYDDNKAYALEIKKGKLNIKIPGDYINEEVEICVYDKETVEENIKTGRVYVTDDKILEKRKLYDNLVFLSSRLGEEKYDHKDYLELDFFQKDNVLILDPQGRNIIFFRTKWYV